jgi:putative ABC transport system permease protein
MLIRVTPPYQVVQDYRFVAGPLADPDVRERRYVVVLGYDVADKLFGGADQAIGRRIRLAGREMTVKAVTAKKGRVLGQSFDGFALVPISTFEAIYGRRKTTTVSVKMASADLIPSAMERAEEAMRVACVNGQRFHGRQSRCPRRILAQPHQVLFTVVPAVVCIGTWSAVS